ncbi:MAG: hypothetical protein JWP52_2776 [Rhizobacter sp.]|nr:hypothetical protein [Rhizobacter sp.]
MAKTPKAAQAAANGAAHYHNARTVDDVTSKNVRAMRRLEGVAKANRSRSDQLAAVVAQFCGRMSFVYLHVAWFAAWIVLNSLPHFEHFDPYPFTFLILVVSLEAIFLATFILISQNQETRLTERRAELDLQINLLTEQENTQMLRMLSQIAKKLDVKLDDDLDLAALEQATRPEKLAEQIEQADQRERERTRR